MIGGCLRETGRLKPEPAPLRIVGKTGLKSSSCRSRSGSGGATVDADVDDGVGRQD